MFEALKKCSVGEQTSEQSSRTVLGNVYKVIKNDVKAQDIV